MLRRLEESGDIDHDTPWYEGIGAHARRSVGAALTCLDHACAGENSFALMRPPGHHATPTRSMGFCYLNQAAITALEARARGFQQVAVFDFDVHHGNGTEEILHARDGFSYHSVHQHPCYPGTGTHHRGNCRNYPVMPGLSAAAHRAVLHEAWEDMLALHPDMVILSAGFDAFHSDPIAQQQLTEEDFHWLGTLTAQLPCPSLAVLEGGYSPQLPDLILAFLTGWES